jgi:formimidoylglutamate deiminase
VTSTRTYVARLGVVDGTLVHAVRWDVDAHGTIVRAGQADAMPDAPAPIVRDLGHALVVPGFVNAHSHAFQRAIRGRTHRRRRPDDDFWSWREAMYERANALDPDGVYAITKQAYAEMLAAGITTVGEFHYLHHTPDGSPYADANELSKQVLRAAEAVGIRVVLLEVFYERAGAGRPPLPEQRRFCDRDVDAYLARVDALRSAGAAIGLAPHSVRAVGHEALVELVAYATHHDLVMHAHVSEQARENAECLAEHGCSPTHAFARAGALRRPARFTAVHAVCTDADDHRALAGQFVCACPTTEADLGDGLLPASELRAAGVSLALGSDSNAVIDAIQEARLLEMGERLRAHRRICMDDDTGLGLGLLRIATEGGARSLGLPFAATLAVGAPFDAVVIGCDHPALRDVDGDDVLDAVLTTGTAGLVERVFVGGVERVP